MAEPSAPCRPLDAGWLRANPVPEPASDVDKNSRARVLALGGCLDVPGGIRLTAEAALRAGAGKVRVGTVEPVALALGTLFPEVAVLSLPVSACGEIDASPDTLAPHLERCDAIVVGPAMTCESHAARLMTAVLETAPDTCAVVVDAAALMGLESNAHRLRRRGEPCVLTPHIGEMAAMLGRPAEEMERDRDGTAREAARRFNAVVVLKGGTTLVAEPSGGLLAYSGGNAGLATGGSGDVLAGVIAALLARGCNPLQAAAWAVWLHGEAGRRCARTIGPLGFLASELLTAIPLVLQTVSDTRGG